MNKNFPYQIHKAKATMYSGEVSPIQTSNGYYTLTISQAGKWDAVRVDIKFPLLSVWVDYKNPKVLNTCKVHALIPQNPTTPQELAAKEFAADLRQYTPYKFGLCNQSLSVDEYSKILRHGVVDNINYEGIDTETNQTTPIFDNKSMALKNIIEFIVSNTDYKLSGIDLINLNNVSDGVLEQIGFTKVPDRLGFGIPMWSGDPLKALQPDVYGGGYWRSRRDRDKLKETAEAFVKIIEEELTIGTINKEI